MVTTAERPATTATDLVSTGQAARILGASRSVVHFARLSGRLPAVFVHDRYLIPREAVEALKAERNARLEHKETPERV